MSSSKERVFELYPDAICVNSDPKTYVIHFNTSENYQILGCFSSTEEDAWKSAEEEILEPDEIWGDDFEEEEEEE